MIISIKYSISTNKTFARTQRAQYIARLQLTHRISCNSLFLRWEGESTFALQEASPRLNYWWTWCVCTVVVGYKLFSGEILYWVTSHPTLLARLPNVIVDTSFLIWNEGVSGGDGKTCSRQLNKWFAYITEYFTFHTFLLSLEFLYCMPDRYSCTHSFHLTTSRLHVLN